MDINAVFDTKSSDSRVYRNFLNRIAVYDSYDVIRPNTILFHSVPASTVDIKTTLICLLSVEKLGLQVTTSK